MKIQIDERIYDLDLIKVGPGVYSALLNGRSHNLELIVGKNGRDYTVNTFNSSYDVEIIDPQIRYRLNRLQGSHKASHNNIISPMPGKLLEVLVKEGDRVEVGQTVLIISAMKMESEFKAATAGIVKKINARKGDTVEGNKVLMVIE
ncbi:MAG: biotin/lipoyl-containing protein [Bacteroidales bacterium]|nr:biotin/lipoyl-containing protein [Bacteroidales bacterium]